MSKTDYRDEGLYFNLRCSRNNPQHVYVSKILGDLNTDIYKSRNQFVMDAVEFYSKSLNQEDLTNNSAMEHIKKERRLTVEDLEAVKKEIHDEVMISLQRDVIAILGYAIGKGQEDRVRTVQTPVIKEEELENVINPIVADMASLWGADEEETEA
ncbi:MAG: hypothetical protein IJX63_12200 [Lachnospiraceae bacterium]|nr:hypothetical protein [Lachnospiraceae bacterium]